MHYLRWTTTRWILPADRLPGAVVHVSTPNGESALGAGVSGLAFRTPSASALPNALNLSRAIRPLKRRVPSRTRLVLDEERTVQCIADESIWIPRLRPASERWLDIALVVEESARWPFGIEL